MPMYVYHEVYIVVPSQVHVQCVNLLKYNVQCM